EIDEIKQADLFKRAALFEMNAIENQESIIALYQKQGEVEAMDAEMVQALVKNRAFPEDETTIVDEAIADNSGEDGSGFDEGIDEGIEPKENPGTLVESLDGNETSESVSTESETTEISEAELLVAETEVKESVESSFPEPKSFATNLIPVKGIDSEANLSLDDREMIETIPELAAISEVNAELNSLDASRQNAAERRQALVDNITSAKESLVQLNMAKMIAPSQAEKSGFEASIAEKELELEKYYAELDEVDGQISELNEAIETTNTRYAALVIELEVADVIAEKRAEDRASIGPAPVAASSASPELKLAEDNNLFFTNENARNYLFEFPEVLEEEVFSLVETSSYSEDQPIPMDLEMPTGVVYKVQVGAFRNPIPQDLFNGFTPISGENTGTGLKRYTVGLFKTFVTADLAKEEVHDIGYDDAFVVAYRDGVRIPLYEARSITDAGIDTESIAIAKEEKEASSPSSSPRRNGGGVNSQTTLSQDQIDEAIANAEIIDEPAPVSSSSSSSSSSPSLSASEDWSSQQGSYLTVQVGVYSKRVSKEEIGVTGDVMIEALDNGYFRYTLGKFTDRAEAELQKESARSQGVSDAFLTAYVDGKRVAVSAVNTQAPSTQEATPQPVQEVETIEAPESPEVSKYRVVIGTFANEVPSKIAIAMLEYESTFGISQVVGNSGTTYFCRWVNDRSQAEVMQQIFSDEGVEIVGIEEQ
ncbi:MAG: hypothetical protein HRT74_11805, partial [Flavobacteriales bacterium]|nr:hypothetical protein [Flavobacteriales bacterium]